MKEVKSGNHVFHYSGDIGAPCVKKVASLLYNNNRVHLDLSSIGGCPQFIQYEYTRYEYAGVSDEVAFYQVVPQIDVTFN